MEEKRGGVSPSRRLVEVGKNVWMRGSVVGPHATCHVGIRCEGECRAQGGGVVLKGVVLRCLPFICNIPNGGCRV